MRIVILLLILGLLFYAILWWLGRKPATYRNLTPQRLQGMAKALRDRGFAGTLLFVTVARDKRFVQFRKYVGDRGEAGIEMGFPRAPWSEAYFARVQREIEVLGVPFEIEETGSGPTTAFLMADFGNDVDMVERAITSITKNVFGVDPEADCMAHIEGDLADVDLQALKKSGEMRPG